MSRAVLSLLLVALANAVSSPAAMAPEDTLKVWVRLMDKGPGTASPGAVPARVFSPGRASRAYEDLSVHEPYVSALEAEGFACETRLKWQNLLSGRIPRSRLERLRALPFVVDVSELARKSWASRMRTWAPWLPGSLRKPGSPEADSEAGRPDAAPASAGTLPDLGANKALADSLNLLEVMDWMDKSGLRPGRGMRVAVIDADFHLGHQAFARLRNEGRIKDQYDFVDDRPQAVTADLAGSHGAQCLSLIGGYLPGVFVGGAYEAEFLLYRSESGPMERYVEEDYQAAAVERAVDSGAQVISISVVYRTEFDSEPDIPLAELDGRTRPSTLAALGAARRNVLVVSAMGNWDGVQSRISSLSVPSDADSILAVGIVGETGEACGYSTTGPTADGRIKPELVSMGAAGGCRVAIPDVATAQGLTASQGTSFAAPAVAALAVLLRQALPGKSAQEIRQALLSTARNASAPNNQIGRGLPDAWAALGRPQVSVLARPVASRAAQGTVGFDAAGRLLPASPAAAGMRFRPPHPNAGAAGTR